MRPMANINNIPRISSGELSKILLSESKVSANLDESIPPSKTAVVDVRDNDHIGGHIKYSIHMPSNTLDTNITDLVRRLKDKELVVFHCALSQQRGPSAALKYLREREKIQGSEVLNSENCECKSNQRVFILDKGFNGWQKEFGEDARLTEGFVKCLWA
ncbi:putative cdc25 family phosphatase ibp1 protein [Erysiphe necator]|uniref:Putative cdc25 family phosphatase ibp1 protein n=1 Tax=Uncinula necator TaxID=52586 RepID=A0A0B1PHT3_UNCNE|nr:putative cdc25 family phosphatase ibp1 protein [Erysiphe necator]